jgi:hypothetical protein
MVLRAYGTQYSASNNNSECVWYNTLQERRYSVTRECSKRASDSGTTVIGNANFVVC